MSSRWRSASLGSTPVQKPKERSRAGSTAPVTPEVRCACQFFQSDSLLPDRINPVGSRSSSRADKSVEYYKSDATTFSREDIHLEEPEQEANFSYAVSPPTPAISDIHQADFKWESKQEKVVNEPPQDFRSTVLERRREQHEEIPKMEQVVPQAQVAVPKLQDHVQEQKQRALPKTQSSEQEHKPESDIEGRPNLQDYLKERLQKEEEARLKESKPQQLFVSRLRDQSEKDAYIPPKREDSEESINELEDLTMPDGSKKPFFTSWFQKSPKDESHERSVSRDRKSNKSTLERKDSKKFTSWLQKSNKSEENKAENQADNKDTNQQQKEISTEQADSRKPLSFTSWLQKPNKDEIKVHVIEKPPEQEDNILNQPTETIIEHINEPIKRAPSISKWFHKSQKDEPAEKPLSPEEDKTLNQTEKPADDAVKDIKQSHSIKSWFHKKEEPTPKQSEPQTEQKDNTTNQLEGIQEPKNVGNKPELFVSRLEQQDQKSQQQNKEYTIAPKISVMNEKAIQPVLTRPQSIERPTSRQYTQHRSRADDRPTNKLMEHYDQPEIRRAVMTSPVRRLPSPVSPAVLYDSGQEDGLDSNARDHEYESIGDPDSESGQKPKDQHADDEHKTVHSDVSSTTSAERKQLQATSSIDEQSPPEENVDSDREMTVQEMQQQIEDKFFKPPEEKSTLPSIQVETPEVAPEQDEAQAASPRTVGQRGREMQRRFKAQAGVLKTKFKGMKKPSFTLPERKKPKLSDETESSVKSRLSNMPKISMPEFKMPDRPKLSMPEFKMPERAKMSMPQFKMPDRSKFKMPERPHMPDFKMPDRPKMPDFKMPDRPKMPDFKMPEFKIPNLKRNNSLKEHASSESTAESKKRIALDFRTYPRIFSKKSRDEEYVTSSPKDERMPVESATVPRAAARKKGPVGARWVNRFSDIKFVDDGLTDARRGDFEDRLHRLDEDYKQMQQEQEYDEDVQPDVSIERSVKTGESFDRGGDSLASEEYSGQPNNRYWADEEDIDHENRDFNYGVPVSGEQTPASTQEERGSSGESYERHRMGVLDELDADEYYLRQKGISEDDIQVEKYLSSEIRDAFKTPVNALEQLGSYNGYDDRDLDLNDYSASRDIGIDDDLDMDVSLTPLKPERTRSLRKPRLLDEVDQHDFDGRSDDFARSNEGINGYNTFPPNRPRRQKKTKKTKETKDDIPPYNVDLEFNDENDRNLLNRDDVDNFDRLMYENEVMEGKTQPDILVIKPKLLSEDRRFYENEEEFASNRDINAYENEENYKNLLADQIPPRAPRRKRKRSARDVSASSEPGSMINAQFHDDWPSLTQLPPDMDDDIIVHRVEHEYVIPLAESEHFPSPTPPRRTRSRSLASRTTAADDDRTSHGAESLISDNQQPPLAKDSARNILDIHDGSGYAVVKRTPSVPKRRKRASKSAEDRPGFSTTPRMKEPPPRPPPRGISAPDLSKTSPDITQYEEVEDDERIEDLQAGDVVNKMKDRPLPAPPRPPRAAKRKKKKGLGKKDDLDYKKYDDVEEEVRLKFLDDEDRRLSLEERNILDRLRQTDYGSTENIDLEQELLERALIRDIAGRMVDDVILDAESHVEQRNAEEAEMWTQTDPLPDDFVCEEVETGPDTKYIEPTILKDDWKEPKVFTEDISMSTLERNKDDSKHDKLRHDSSKGDSRLDPLDIERARKIADDESLSRGLRRFRESSRQRTFSSSRTPSERAPSEKALLLERTIVTPTKTEDVDEVLTKATLFVKPVDDELDIEDFLEEQALEKKRKYFEETSVFTPEPTTKDLEHESEIPPEEEPPIPVKRRTSLKKSRPIPVPPLSTEVSQELESPVIDDRILERRVEAPVPPTQDNQVEVLKTNRLQVSNLDVENLNVSQLQANSIKVSEVDGVALQVKELNSKSGNLVVSGIDIAPSVLQDILDKLAPALPHPSSQMSTQTDEPYAEPKEREETAPEIAPERPPPPPISPESMYGQHPYMQQGMYYPYPGSIPPASFYALRPRDYSEEETQQMQATLPRQSRRRHVPKRGSTSEEEHQNQESVPRHRRPGTKSPEPSVREISGQLVRACCNSVQRNVKQAWNVIKTRSNTEEHRREIQIALLILLVFTAGLILIGLSDNKTVHHHHWEFFNPPSDKNA